MIVIDELGSVSREATLQCRSRSSGSFFAFNGSSALALARNNLASASSKKPSLFRSSDEKSVYSAALQATPLLTLLVLFER